MEMARWHVAGVPSLLSGGPRPPSPGEGMTTCDICANLQKGAPPTPRQQAACTRFAFVTLTLKNVTLAYVGGLIDS